MLAATATIQDSMQLLDRLSDPNALPEDALQSRDQPRRDRWLLCARCRRRITPRNTAIEVAGSHSHRRSNPHGVTFCFGCFESAPGAVPRGPATWEHSWFAGMHWRMAECGGCGGHLGWHFQDTERHAFFGLILAGLVEGPGDDND